VTQEIDLESARKALAVERTRRLEMCRQEIQAVLQKYGLELQAQPVILPDGRIGANVLLVRNDQA